MPRRPVADSPPSPQRARWGLREAPEEPIDWRERPLATARFLSAISTPVAAAVVVFVAIGLIFAVTVWLRPHHVAEVGTDPSMALSSQAAGPDDADGGAQMLAGTTGEGQGAFNREAEAGAIGGGDAARIVVHIVGEVLRPGIVELHEGARVADAIEEVGGVTPNAIISAVNLARVLVDGEQVLVPNATQAEHLELVSTSGGATAQSGRVNLNRADASALETLPRVGPSLAARIIEWRDANGGFASTEQLLDVSGIGQKTYEQLRELVTV